MTFDEIRVEAWKSVRELDAELAYYEAEVLKATPEVWHRGEVVMSGEEAREFLMAIIDAGRALHSVLLMCMPYEGKRS
jgi:hypothetical protein